MYVGVYDLIHTHIVVLESIFADVALLLAVKYVQFFFLGLLFVYAVDCVVYPDPFACTIEA